MLVYKSNIVPKWNIKTEENYFVASDNKVYNLKTKKKLQIIQRDIIYPVNFIH